MVYISTGYLKKKKKRRNNEWTDRYSVTHSTKSDLDFNNGVTCFGKRGQDKNNKGIVGIRGLAGETPAPPFSAALSS